MTAEKAQMDATGPAVRTEKGHSKPRNTRDLTNWEGKSVNPPQDFLAEHIVLLTP